MSVKVIDVKQGVFKWERVLGSYYELLEDAEVMIRIRDDLKREYWLKVFFVKGYACDGLSVPKIFRWFLKNWDKQNPLYNIAGAVHDALYGNKGFAFYSRSECDDIFRGMLREAGKDRKHASIADLAVGIFAGSHWGDDSLDSADLVKISRSFLYD